jgi:excisionase family DNA binding protein
MDELLTTSQAAQKLGVSAGRVRQMVADGQLPVVRLGRDNLIRAADLALVKDRKTGRPPKDRDSSKKESRSRKLKKRNRM